MAAQALTHHAPYCMPYSLKYVEATPENVIWENLALNPYGRRFRVVLSWTVGIVFIMIWIFLGKPRLNLTQPTSRAKTYISVVYHDGHTYLVQPVPSDWRSLRLQPLWKSHPLPPGYPLCAIAYGPLHARSDGFTCTYTLGRHHSKDTRRAQDNGSGLRNQYHCACVPCCS